MLPILELPGQELGSSQKSFLGRLPLAIPCRVAAIALQKVPTMKQRY